MGGEGWADWEISKKILAQLKRLKKKFRMGSNGDTEKTRLSTNQVLCLHKLLPTKKDHTQLKGEEMSQIPIPLPLKK